MNKTTYKAILFAPDGQYVTDFRDREDEEEVWEDLMNMGSKWIFYPFHVVANDQDEIVDGYINGMVNTKQLIGMTVEEAAEVVAEKATIEEVQVTKKELRL